ncbi:hypothetical protein, partial [Bradyrhizobium sp.]
VFLRVRNAQLKNSANAASLGFAPHVRAREEEIGRLPRPTQAKSDDKGAAISPGAVAMPAPRLLTGLTQRLTEARRLSEATRTEYDD